MHLHHPSRAGTLGRRLAGLAAAAVAAGAPAVASGAMAQTPVPVGHATEHVEIGSRYVWTAGDRSLTRIHPTGLRVAGTRAIPRPTGLAAAGGRVWLQTPRATWRVDERTFSRRRAAGAARGGAVAASGDAVWFADGRRVRRIDPRTSRPDGAVAQLPTRVGAVALGEGSLWVGSTTRPRIWRLDPVTGARRGSVRLERVGDHEDCGAPAATIAAGGGVVWVAFGDTPRCPDRAPRIVALDPDTLDVVGGADDPSDDEPESAPRPAALAAVPGGAWYARANLGFTDGRPDGPAALRRLSWRGGEVEFDDASLEWFAVNEDVVDEPGHPRDAAHRAGVTWIARSNAVVRVGRAGPASRRSVTIPGLRDVAAVGNRVWVLSDRGLERVDPRTGKPLGPRRRVTGERLVADERRIWVLDGRRIAAHDANNGTQLNWFTLAPDDPALLAVDHGSAVTGTSAGAPRRALLLLRQSVFTGHHTGSAGPLQPASSGGLVFDAIAAAPGGAWYVGTHAVRVDTLGRVVRRQSLGGARAVTSATVRRGTLWLADADRGILAIPARGGRVTTRATIPVPTALATDARSLWILSAATGFVDRLDLRTGRRTVRPFELPEATAAGAGIAAGAGALWIADPATRGGLLTRVAPRT